MCSTCENGYWFVEGAPGPHHDWCYAPPLHTGTGHPMCPLGFDPIICNDQIDVAFENKGPCIGADNDFGGFRVWCCQAGYEPVKCNDTTACKAYENTLNSIDKCWYTTCIQYKDSFEGTCGLAPRPAGYQCSDTGFCVERETGNPNTVFCYAN